MNTITEKVEPSADLLCEVDQPEENPGSPRSTGWLGRLKHWVDFLRDVVKILAE